MDNNDSLLKVKVIPNGPLKLEGQVALILADGTSIDKVNPCICRCGSSGINRIVMAGM